MQRRNFLQAASLFPFLSLPAPVLKPAEGKNRKTGMTAGSGEAPHEFFYKPANAWAADFIPLYANGEFQLFYLLDWRDEKKHGEGTPWYRISTRDFVHFKEHGEMLPRGTKDQQDLYVFTGSAIHAKDQYHIFYTGENPHLRAQGKPEQAVMHAVSEDMNNWKKIPADTFFAPGDRYEKNDWRDPFVFWNEEAGEYNMLLAARHKEGIPRRRGLTALCASRDLTKWEVREPFYSPGLYYTHECPDLFKMGDWWYLLFSEFTDRVRTRYRMSRSLKGPWIIPEKDDFDGHAFYAAKTASDGKNRFIFGWNPTRHDSKDNGYWEWGGNLVVHQVHQEDDGTLSVRVPETVDAAFKNAINLEFNTGSGDFHFSNGKLNLKAPGGFAAAVGGKMPDTCKIEVTAKFGKGTRECGIMLRCSEDLEKAYYLKLEPANNKLVFDMWPRDRAEVTQMVELERDIALTAGEPIRFQVFINGNKGVVYINDSIAMNFRAYDLPEGSWGVFVSEGSADFDHLRMATL